MFTTTTYLKHKGATLVDHPLATQKNNAIRSMNVVSAGSFLERTPVVTQYYGASTGIGVGSLSEIEMLGGAEQTLG